MGVEENRFRHTNRLALESERRAKETVQSDELQSLIDAVHLSDSEKVTSKYEIASDYVTDGYEKLADGLKTLRGINDPQERKRKSRQLSVKRQSMVMSVEKSLVSSSFTELEKDQLRWLLDCGAAFESYIAKNIRVFESKYDVSKEQAAVLSNVATAETQQSLAELVIKHVRRASDIESAGGPRGSQLYLETTVFPLFNAMATRAMGVQEGTRLSETMQSGVYGLAAAYLMYSDASRNKFGKSFKVVFPPPHLDALEQVDLILIDEENMPDSVREEITKAIDTGLQGDYAAINKISKDAKAYVYKVQVKSKNGGKPDLLPHEREARDKFISARCTSMGFDNYDYLVLNQSQARAIVQDTRGSHE